MKRPAVTVSSVFLLFVAILYFLDDSGLLSAVVPAVVLHELSHLLALRRVGAAPTRLSIGMSGLCIDYFGDLNAWEEIITALAGPAGGLAGALLCSQLGRMLASRFWTCCAGVGLLLSGFNLLPAMPLDGGRALFYCLSGRCSAAKARRILNVLGMLISISLILAGFFLFFRRCGIAVLAAGFWLLVLGVDAPCKTPKVSIK